MKKNICVKLNKRGLNQEKKRVLTGFLDKKMAESAWKSNYKKYLFGCTQTFKNSYKNYQCYIN